MPNPEEGNAVPRGVITFLTLVLALSALVGFVYLIGGGILQAWTATAKPPNTPGELQIGTILSGFIGGIVAAGFGQKPAKEQEHPEEKAKDQHATMEHQNQHSKDTLTATQPTPPFQPVLVQSPLHTQRGGMDFDIATRLRSNLLGLTSLFFALPRFHVLSQGQLRQVIKHPQVKWRALLAGLYAIAYVTLGVAALAVTYLLRPATTPDLVRSMADVCFGLFIAILRSFFDSK